ncbi:MAG: DASS family sodium-coupled anion symporter [Halorientalis sp.]
MVEFTPRNRLLVFLLICLGTGSVAFAPRPPGLTIASQYALATMFFAGALWVTGALPLSVTALSVPVLLTVFGVYDSLEPALYGFADPLIFLFIAGFMLANALQKYNIDRRIALWLVSQLGTSARRLILAIMIATAMLSMWVSNTATTAMMTPIALGVLAQVVGREPPEDGAFSNMQVATLLGVAYAASVGGVGTLIGTPPNAVLVGYLDSFSGYQLTFTDWLVIGVPIVVVSLPLVWWVLTFVLYPPEVTDVTNAREEARRYLLEEGTLDPRGRRVAVIFAVTALLWAVGGLGGFFSGLLPPKVHTTLFGGPGPTLFGTDGHQGMLYFPLVGLYAIPTLVLADTMDWQDLADIDWGTILLFGGGLSLADALAKTNATAWLANTVFRSLVGAPIVAIVGAVVAFVILLTEMTSNTATTSIIVPLLIGLGAILAGTLGLDSVVASIFLGVVGTIAASFAFALPVSTPPNAIVFGSGHIDQKQMLRAGMLLNVLMTVVLTLLITFLFYVVWPHVLW